MDQPPVTPPAGPVPMGPASDTSKVIALLGYIFAPLGLIALALDPYKDEPWVRLHVWQGAAVWLVGFVLSWFTFGLGSLAAWIYQIILGIQAYQGQTPHVPVLFDAVKGLAKYE